MRNRIKTSVEYMTDKQFLTFSRRLERGLMKHPFFTDYNGLTFGWDMPTLRVVYPCLWATINDMRAEYRRRGLKPN